MEHRGWEICEIFYEIWIPKLEAIRNHLLTNPNRVEHTKVIDMVIVDGQWIWLTLQWYVGHDVLKYIAVCPPPCDIVVRDICL